ncbi:MAG: PEP-CTERM sorting domain-containing protein [Bryobacterales bacterium]|nr:PEP-CTERM sorting domain-containing protein [Bryobacterales bacterium]
MKKRFSLPPFVAILAATFCSPTAVSAASLVYVTTANQAFGTLDLDTGIFTQTGFNSEYLLGLGKLGGTLYGAGNDGNLYSVNTANGSLSLIAPLSANIWELGSTTSGLYGLGPNYTNLYSIDAATGVATLLGPTGIVTANTSGFSVGASALYLMISSPGASSLYSLNTTTGASTLIGASSPGVCLKNMAEVNGILYSASGYCFVGSKTFTVNPANGASSLLATVSGFDDLLGMAPVAGASAVPEPSTGVMLLLGILLLRRRRA